MLDQYQKAVKKEILRLSSLAYEREMNRELAALLVHFRAWASGKLHPLELSDHIHRFHNGAARELYKQYCTYQGCADMLVARALATGLIRADEVTAETLAALEPRIRNATDELEEDQSAAEDENPPADE